MENSGSGVTFSEHDTVMIRKVIGLLNKAKFDGVSATQIMEASETLFWLRDSLLKHMDENVMELKKVVDPKAKKAK